MTIERFSSRRSSLTGFLPERLRGAHGYDRIAGYFSSSVLEIAGEALESMAPGAVTRVVCNSGLQPLDVVTARAAAQAMQREWTSALPEDISPALKACLQRLFDFLSSRRLQVKVLPDSRFGLEHGKAGVITDADGNRLCFIGSANESRMAWERNYELVWTDRSQEGVRWVQEEFEALWCSPDAVPLAEAVVQEIARLSHRVVIPSVEQWRQSPQPDPAAPVVELPLYRRENGLWAHQKYFVRLAFEAHKRGGARYVLADQVGLGKTVQLALAAKLMALWGERPVLVLAPKSLLTQWQDELWSLLAMPCAVWNGRGWIDEHGITHAESGIEELRRCPRRVGIVSTGLLTQGGEAAEILKALQYECVILDEAHRARRRNLGPTHKNQPAEPNNLLHFLRAIAPRTKSLLLATATPVQLDPIEAFDLLEALNEGSEQVFGRYSRWAGQARTGLGLIQGQVSIPTDLAGAWEWIRTPLPPAEESLDFAILRKSLDLPDSATWAQADALDGLRRPDQDRVRRLVRDFFPRHNPYIRHIVRRTRDYLEQTIDPRTHEPFLKPVRVRLFGERDDEALNLPLFLHDAYETAERFCDLLGQRPGLNSGFLKTILLRRVGSTILSGKITAGKMLGQRLEDDEDDDDEAEQPPAKASALYPLTETEHEELSRFLYQLGANHEQDPKYQEIERILLHGVEGTEPWLTRGCIIFSQYYDSAFWLAQRLSERLPEETVAVYAAASGSGLMRSRVFTRLDRETLKAQVRSGETRLVVGTDAASEGLNLQRLGSLINLDLPWNPTRLEQRKGRIQRIGQLRDEVFVYNLRYRGSVEDRVHDLLSLRLQSIKDLFGQVPDTLGDVWVAVAQRDEQKAREIIDQLPPTHPFEMKYDRVEQVDWESCSTVLDSVSQLEVLTKGW
ncbi:MAG: phospholipase D-like domain-containing anti-phage protein [Dehalococcoidia bacterium]